MGCAFYASIKAFWDYSSPLMSITSSVELYSVIFLASSSMVDVTSMCICPCDSTSTTSQSTSSLYHSTNSVVISSGSSDQSSQIVYNATINGNNTTSASASLSSSVCYCPCSPATSTSYMSCKYACRDKQFRGNFLENWKYLFEDLHSSIHERIPARQSFLPFCWKPNASFKAFGGCSRPFDVLPLSFSVSCCPCNTAFSTSYVPNNYAVYTWKNSSIVEFFTFRLKT